MRGKFFVFSLSAIALLAGCGGATAESADTTATGPADVPAAETADATADAPCWIHLGMSREGMLGQSTLAMARGQVAVLLLDTTRGVPVRIDAEPRSAEHDEVCTLIARASDARWPDVALTFDGNATVTRTVATDAGPVEIALSRGEPVAGHPVGLSDAGAADDAGRVPQAMYAFRIDDCDGNLVSEPRYFLNDGDELRVQAPRAVRGSALASNGTLALTCTGLADAPQTAASCRCVAPTADGTDTVQPACTMEATDESAFRLSFPDTEHQFCVSIDVRRHDPQLGFVQAGR